MDDELRHAGFQVLQRSEIKLRPFFRRNFRFNRNRMVQHDIARIEALLQVWMASEPISGDENRQLVLVSHLQATSRRSELSGAPCKAAMAAPFTESASPRSSP